MKEELLRLVPTYEALATTSKVHLVQSIVSRVFVNSIFEQYFVGLPKEHSTELQSVERYLGGFGELYSRCRGIGLIDLRLG